MCKLSDLVVKSNEIINGQYQLSINEMRILHSVIANIDSRKPMSEKQIYTLAASDYRDLLSDQSFKVNIYQVMCKSAERLRTKYVRIKNDQGYLDINWFSWINYNNEDSIITMKFNPDIFQYVSEIKKNFTAYQLKDLMQFKSEYTYRFYELLKEYKEFGSRKLMVDEIRYKLGLENKYKTTALLKTWVIDPVINDLKSRSDINIIAVTPIKEKRKIIAYTFTFEPQKHKPRQITAQQIKDAARPGETAQQIIERLRN